MQMILQIVVLLHQIPWGGHGWLVFKQQRLATQVRPNKSEIVIATFARFNSEIPQITL